MKKLTITAFCFSLLLPVSMQAQNESTEVDASKPTNFYSFIDNSLEYSSQPNQNLMGYRANLTLAPSSAHLILAEIPLLYNDRTDKFGLGDIRARYFYLPYKNYDKFFGAFGPSVDIFAPTGSNSNGLGSGRWIVSPGITIGLMAAEWIQFFPIISYQYASKYVSEIPEGSENKADHGLTFQVLIPIIVSSKLFFQLTPSYNLNNINDERGDTFTGRVFASYALNTKMQITTQYYGLFKAKINTFNLGLTVFF